MAIHDTEEEQLEQLKKWWEVNHTSVVAGVVGGLVLLAGFNFWEQNKLQNRTQASQLYQELLDSAANSKPESVEKIAEKINTEFPSSAYADYATLQEAKVKVEKGDLAAARTLLEEEIKRTGSPELRHICRLRLIQLLLADKQYEQGLKLIAEVDPASSEGFSALYDELQGDLYVAMDRPDEARSAYQSAIRTGLATQLVQFKLDDITAPAFDQNGAK
ncbi:MAG: tetratricopeptide repeat protein [Methylococcales bacterium]|nr:tetratricopeptide repeat protein [Methylococcales bacterium]